MEKILKAISMGIVYTCATVGTLLLTVLAYSDFNIIVSFIIYIICVLSIFYSFLKIN